MSRRPLLTDLAIALGLMIVLVIVSPGLAVVGLIALLGLVICAVSFALERRGRRHRRLRS